MKYAFLNGNKVFKVEDTPSDIAIECADEVQAGWLYNGTFNPPPGSLAFARNQKLQEINSLRSVYLESPVTYNGNLYDADKNSSANLVAVVSAVNAGIPLPTGFNWRTADNTNVTLNAVQLVELASTMLATTNSIYATSWAKKELVNLATTIEEVNNVVW